MADIEIIKFDIPGKGECPVADAVARGEIASVKEAIPEGVSSENPLASQEYVDVAVATNSARYIYYTNPSTGETGPFPSLAALEAYAGEVDNNDYAFVLGRDDNGKPVYSRYKYVVDPEASGDEGSWVLEYVMPMPTSAADVGAADMRALAPLFEEHKPYAVGTLVSYEGLMYRCTEEITGTSNERMPDTDIDHWKDIPVSEALEMVVDEIPQPSDDDSDVEMDGEASAGSADTWSRSDHRHPHDTSKADKYIPTTEGNFASLDSTGNLQDSGKNADSFKLVQSPVSDPEARTSTSTTFISQISQDEQGVISPVKETLPPFQSPLTFDNVPTRNSTNPVTSGGIRQAIDEATPDDYEEVKAQVTKNASDIAIIESVIPAQASTDNKLADKNFVNSSVATNTAYYVSYNGGPFPSVEALEAYDGVVTNNDYAFVVGEDYEGNTTYTRYKFVETPNDESDSSSMDESDSSSDDKPSIYGYWAEEYVLNNSSFTAEQWAAISSGITSGAVDKLNDLPTAEELALALAGKVPTTRQVNDKTLSEDINLDAADVGAVPILEALTWSELKAKRDGGLLVPGASYRITDYVATTNGDMSSRSANHPFDIIVVADDTNKLNETARAIQHEGDTYFNGCNLAAWKIQYCLDNDTNRFAWAVADNATGVFDGTAPFTGGHGVVYRMVDEFGNDVPYDFKGLKFLAYGDTDNVYRYTFDNGDSSNNTDYSVTGPYGRAMGNKIGMYIGEMHQRLNRIVFKGSSCHDTTFGNGCYSNTSGKAFSNNTFGNLCHDNTFGNHCYDNTFGTLCHDNTFGNGFRYSTFGNDCFAIAFKNDSERKNFISYVTIESGNQYLDLDLRGTSSSLYPYRNVTVKAGVNNKGAKKTIRDDTDGGQRFHTTYKPAGSKEISVSTL